MNSWIWCWMRKIVGVCIKVHSTLIMYLEQYGVYGGGYTKKKVIVMQSDGMNFFVIVGDEYGAFFFTFTPIFWRVEFWIELSGWFLFLHKFLFNNKQWLYTKKIFSWWWLKYWCVMWLFSRFMSDLKNGTHPCGRLKLFMYRINWRQRQHLFSCEYNIYL